MWMRVGACLLVVVAAWTAGGCTDDPDGPPDAAPVADGAPGAADAARADDAAPPADAAAGEDASLADGGPPDAGPLPDAAIEMCGRIRCDCTLNGIPLFGQVEYVDNFADFQVRVESFPDLLVREGNFADECGEWEIVDNFPDFTVELVDAFEDFSIEYSDFPGIP